MTTRQYSRAAHLPASAFRFTEPTIGRESYMHRAAKEVMARWLREAAAEVGFDECAELGPIAWRVNRDGPMWGIWEEYPFTGPDRSGRVWDEDYAPQTGENGPWRHSPPPVVNGFAAGERVSFVADIAVQHKGSIWCVVEIMHRHSCTIPKRAYYEQQGISMYEVPARWVLLQTARPRRLLARRGANPCGKFEMLG